MKKIFIVLGVLIGVLFFGGCTVKRLDSSGNVISVKNYGPSLSSDRPLTESELRSKLISHEIYRNTESFFVLKNHKLFYYNKVTREREYGSWVIRKVYNPSTQKRIDSFCIVKGQVRSAMDMGTRGICMRFYPEDDKHGNLYLGVYVRCQGLNDKRITPICKEYNKYDNYYRFKKSRFGK